MKLKVIRSRISASTKTICIIHESDAVRLGVSPLERVVLRNKKHNKRSAAIVDTTKNIIQRGHIIIDDELASILKVKSGDVLEAEARGMLLSKSAIRKKINNEQITLADAEEIAGDIIKHNLNDLEISSFITALTINGLSDKEIYYMSRAMIETGEHLNFGRNSVDKHSIGGIPGDKTSLLLVPVIAASGLVIPKTSSRAITSPAGTADRMEILAPVVKTKKEIKIIVQKTGGCLIWGGSFDLAPADDLFIEIERPLEQDPLLLPSVLSKKKVIGAKYIAIDIPVGPEAKVHSNAEAHKLGKRFRRIGKMLGMRIDYVITDGRQPIGRALGPALEAREALQILMTGKDEYLVRKVVKIAAVLLKMKKKSRSLKEGKRLALKIIESGIAEMKLREIIKAQGGNPDIMPEKIKISKFSKHVHAKHSGKVRRISIRAMQQISRLAGSPADKKAGMILDKKLNDKVKKGEILYTIYAEHRNKLADALNYAKKDSGYIIK